MDAVTRAIQSRERGINMSNIELVIKIPDKYMKGRKVENGSLVCEHILEAVYDGIPLPKGHGRLIDADELKKKQFTIGTSNYCEYDVVSTYEIDKAPTIIEADKE